MGVCCSPLLSIFSISAGSCSFPHSQVNESVCRIAGEQHERSKQVHMKQLQKKVEAFASSICAARFFLSHSRLLAHLGLFIPGSAWTSTAASPAPLWSCWQRKIPSSEPLSWAQTSRSSAWLRWSSGTVCPSGYYMNVFAHEGRGTCYTYIHTLIWLTAFLYILAQMGILHVVWINLVFLTLGTTMRSWRSSVRCLPRTC